MVCDCCSPGDPTDGLEAKIKPYDQRRCTDILWFLIFLMSWGVIWFLLGWTLEQGANPQVVIRGVDWQGIVCGKDGKTGYEDYPYCAWPDPIYGPLVRVCLADCNYTQEWEFTIKYETVDFAGAYCVPKAVYKVFDNPPNDTEASLNGEQFSSKSAIQRAMGDMVTAWPIMIASAGIALGLSFLYTYFTQQCGRCLVVLLVLMIAVAGGLCGYGILAGVYSQKQDPIVSFYTQASLKAQEIIGWAFVVGTVIFVIIIFAIRKQLWLAMEVIKEAADAIQDMPWLMCFPVFPFLVGMLYMALWISICCFIFSVTHPESRVMDDLYKGVQVADMAGQYKTVVADYNLDANLNFAYLDYEFNRLNNQTLVGMPSFGGAYVGNYTLLIWNPDLQYAFAVNFFHLLWVVQFIIYFTYLVFAGAVAEWYFTDRDEAGKKKTNQRNCRDSFARATRYHLGSVAFGSFIIAVIQFARAVVHYMQAKAEQLNPGGIQRAIFCMIGCCLYCVECCCDKISKNGFVWVSIWGEDFMTAACSAFKLVWANLLRIAALNLVGDYILLMGKFMVSVATAGISAIIYQVVYGSPPLGRLSSIMMPVFVSWVIGFMVACFFMSLFEVTIDTVFLCFLIDEKNNKGSGNMYASASLVALVDRHGKKSFERAKSMRAPGTDKVDFETLQQNETITPSSKK
eukprot:g61490.t1